MAEYIKADGSVEIIKVRDFKHAQELVGGFVEVVASYQHEGCTLLVNEEGLLLELPLNTTASVLTGLHIVGNALRLSKSETKRIMR
jgi:hypothetical protein